MRITRMGDVTPFIDECGPVREVWQNDRASMARLTMSIGASTKPHHHKVMTEVYTIERGKGMITLDGVEAGVTEGDLIEILPGVEHQLTNTGGIDLELGVICTPPFDPRDVYAG